MTREQLTAILTHTRTDRIEYDDGSYVDWSDGNLEIADANGNAVCIGVDLTDLVHKLAATALAE